VDAAGNPIQEAGNRYEPTEMVIWIQAPPITHIHAHYNNHTHWLILARLKCSTETCRCHLVMFPLATW